MISILPTKLLSVEHRGDAFLNGTSPLYSFQWYSVEGEQSNKTNNVPKT